MNMEAVKQNIHTSASYTNLQYKYTSDKSSFM